MRFIDDRGRLFGKLNVIDLVIVIIIGFGLYWAGSQVVEKFMASEDVFDKYRVVLRAENVHAEMIDAVKVGYKLIERSGNVIGHVDLPEPQLQDAIVYVRTPQGTIEGSTAQLVVEGSIQPKLKDMDITVILEARKGQRIKYNTVNMLVGSRLEYDFVSEGMLGAHMKCLCVSIDKLED
ncbi:MAG TPA: DUF4330 family protein [Caldisericia bacterium]|nr:DUF4330 family protein [Caldisericia bacterium]HPF49154.1 DUF4330 family protein [Caldisericia bacterium]HPI82982.1 DUF4330 family protein [Caldisericia bacterium]HPQ92209.1 DUF4330 family protein [Caldisericia bacterium]HRV74693.1 DUF4330 family protein [Caldisericia bacterium]